MVLETALALAAKPLVEKIVDKLVAPKIEQFSEWCKKNYDEYLIPKAEHFQEYLERSYTKYSIVNTLVFHNSQRLLKEIYVAQTLKKEHGSEDDKETAKIEKLPVSLIKKYKKILITDTAGMGKSTIMKRMFVDLIDSGLGVVGIPIYIELNKLNKEHTILHEIQKELSSLSEQFDNGLLLKFIQTGGFIFFLDGFDEISISDRNEVTNDIQTFVSKAGTNNYFILTSRPEGSLSSFGDFQLFTIQPLTKEESFELLYKYDISKKKELSEKLVGLLNSEHEQYKALDEYLVNPLLVSLLFTAYDFNRSIPFEKHRFYGVVFEAYFEKHDNTKPMKTRDKLSGLNYDGFDRVLRYIGYDSLIDIGVKFNKDTILNSIREAKEYCGNLSFSEYKFLDDLTSSVPLFCQDGTDYKWVHKSLLEYFAARFIYCDAKENQDVILSDIYNSDGISKYINMLDLYYDIDPKGFSKNITLPFCEDYLKFYHSCIVPSNINKELANKRISLLFPGKFAFVLTLKNGRRIIYEDELFEQKKLLDFRGRRFQCRGDYNGIKLYFSYHFDSTIDNLLNLLFAKNIKITIPSRFPDKEEWLPIITDSFEQDVIYDVDMRIGDNNDKTYAAINDMIVPIEWKTLDYQACKKEVERIHKEIDQIKKFPKLPKRPTNG
jgi:hypothetical protein